MSKYILKFEDTEDGIVHVTDIDVTYDEEVVSKCDSIVSLVAAFLQFIEETANQIPTADVTDLEYTFSAKVPE